MGFSGKLITAALVLVFWAPSVFADVTTLRIAALKFGTVNWELNVIKHNGFDQTNGFNLETLPVAGGPAGQIAFQGGEVDILVSDWIWVARQRAAGKDFVFIPYSKAVGGVMVPAGSPAQTLEDLRGQKVGIAGGPVDKSWIILRAYSEQQYGLDLAAETEQVFGGAPLIYKAGLGGEFGGVINFWHYMAKMEAGGMRLLISVTDAAIELGLDPDMPLLGYVVKGEMLRAHPELIEGLANASRSAKDMLATNDAEWDRLRDVLNAANDEEFEALKAGFRAGIPASNAVDEVAAARAFALMAELGGSKLVGDATELPDGVFVDFAN